MRGDSSEKRGRFPPAKPTSIPGSENFGDVEIVEAIAGADYDQPIGRSHPAPPRPPSRGAGPARPPLTLAQRLRGGFRSY